MGRGGLLRHLRAAHARTQRLECAPTERAARVQEGGERAMSGVCRFVWSEGRGAGSALERVVSKVMDEHARRRAQRLRRDADPRTLQPHLVAHEELLRVGGGHALADQSVGARSFVNEGLLCLSAHVAPLLAHMRRAGSRGETRYREGW